MASNEHRIPQSETISVYHCLPDYHVVPFDLQSQSRLSRCPRLFKDNSFVKWSEVCSLICEVLLAVATRPTHPWTASSKREFTQSTRTSPSFGLHVLHYFCQTHFT